MSNMTYTLPPMSFVGGESQKIRFNLKTESGNPFPASGCTAFLAILQYNNKGGTPVITKEIEFQSNADDILCAGIVELLPGDTVSLCGRYIYQITLLSSDGTIEIPGQGLMDIIENIHRSVIQK